MLKTVVFGSHKAYCHLGIMFMKLRCYELLITEYAKSFCEHLLSPSTLSEFKESHH